MRSRPRRSVGRRQRPDDASVADEGRRFRDLLTTTCGGILSESHTVLVGLPAGFVALGAGFLMGLVGSENPLRRTLYWIAIGALIIWAVDSVIATTVEWLIRRAPAGSRFRWSGRM